MSRIGHFTSVGLVIVVLLLLVMTTACDDDGGSGLFGYDEDAPLSVQTVDAWQNGDLRVDKFQVLPIAEDFARTGAVVVAIDAPWSRRKELPDFTERDRADQIQLMVDLRRAVDLLQSNKEVDDDRIAYFGVSYGGAMGGLFAGVEDRLAAVVLDVGDGGLVTHFTGADDKYGALSQVPAARRKRWLDAMRPIEPIKWIGRAEAPILFQSARNDQLVPPADARKYQEAADEPKDVRWYDSDHLLPRKAACDAAQWLEEKVGIEADEHPACV